MVKIKKILESGGARPYQLTAVTECGKTIYLRYRNGRLRWGFLSDYNTVPSKYEFDKVIGDRLDGFPDDEAFKRELGESLKFPELFEFSEKYVGP